MEYYSGALWFPQVSDCGKCGICAYAYYDISAMTRYNMLVDKVKALKVDALNKLDKDDDLPVEMLDTFIFLNLELKAAKMESLVAYQEWLDHFNVIDRYYVREYDGQQFSVYDHETGVTTFFDIDSLRANDVSRGLGGSLVAGLYIEHFPNIVVRDLLIKRTSLEVDTFVYAFTTKDELS